MLSDNAIEELGNNARDLQKVFDNVIDPYRRDLWRYCMSLTRSPWDAEDLVQDTLLKAFSMLGYYFQANNPKSYLFRMATNCWIDKRRANKADIGTLYEENTAGSDEQTASADVIGSMDYLLTTVTPLQAVIVLLSDVFDFTAPEIAEMLHSTEGAVKAALHRARTKLRQANALEQLTATPVSSGIFVSPRLVDAYIAAFNNRDADALANLLTEHVKVDIVHVSEELGRSMTRNHSIEGTVNIPEPMYAEYHVLWGEQAIIWMKLDSGVYGISNITRLIEENDEVTLLRSYYFCPEMLELAGVELGLPVHAYGYHYLG